MECEFHMQLKDRDHVYAQSAELSFAGSLADSGSLLYQWWVSRVIGPIAWPIHWSLLEKKPSLLSMESVKWWKKGQMINKCRHNFWTKHSQRNSCMWRKSHTISCFQCTVFMLIERMIQLPQENSILGIVCILLERKPLPVIIFYESS